MTSPHAAPISAQCRDGNSHDGCGHRPLGIHGANTGPKGQRWKISVSLCGCACHAACHLAAAESVPEVVWSEQCSCPGRETEVERRATRNLERAERRDQMRTVLAQARPDGEASRDEIRARVERALREHDLTWTPGQIDAAVNALAASRGHRALVVPKVIGRMALQSWKRRRP